MNQNVIDPERHLEYFRKIGQYPTCRIPKRVLFIYPRALFRQVCATEDNLRGNGIASGLRILIGHDSLGVVHGPLGAPMAAMLAEQYFALGVQEIVAIGTAGALNDSLSTGDIVVCDKAVTGEGVSKHYLGAVDRVSASDELVAELSQRLERAKLGFIQGPSWTMDAPYCETWDDVRRFREQGVLTVEMEAAALYAVAEKRGKRAITLLVISDRLSEQGWVPEFENPRLVENLKRCFEIVRA